jgi:coenzyme PQQ precursor peptide PqqA
MVTLSKDRVRPAKPAISIPEVCSLFVGQTRRPPAVFSTKAFRLANWIAKFTPMRNEEAAMTWTTPTLVEICIGLEINGYLPAEF